MGRFDSLNHQVNLKAKKILILTKGYILVYI